MPTETACRRSQLACFLGRLPGAASSPRTESAMLVSSARSLKPGDGSVAIAEGEVQGGWSAQPGSVRTSNVVITALHCVGVIICSDVRADEPNRVPEELRPSMM